MIEVLPFSYKRFSPQTYLVVSQGGRFHFLNESEFERLTNCNFPPKTDQYYNLKGKGFIAEDDIELAEEITANQIRARKGHLFSSSFLAMIVVTGRCNFECRYCQVNSLSTSEAGFDLDWSTAKRIIDFIFTIPAEKVKIEFQGGEPLLNWGIVVDIVNYVNLINRVLKRSIEFVVCTNLTLLTEEIARFCKEKQISISTSLDGPNDIQNLQRIPRNGLDGANQFSQKLELAKSILGLEKISPLLTLTKFNIDRIREVIDFYRFLGFPAIFLRDLHLYGSARENLSQIAYPREVYSKRYLDALEHIISLNRKGERFVEYNILMYLQRVLTPFSTGFVDFQSPSGGIINSLIFDHRGKIYPSDEARMLSRMGDETFLLGNVFRKDYKTLLKDPFAKSFIAASILELLPGCSDCVYHSFCAGDPVRVYLEKKTCFISQYGTDFCVKNTFIFDWIFGKIASAPETIEDVFCSWLKEDNP